MRVLLCVPAYKPALDYGGPVAKIGLLAPALQKLGIDVEIATANFGPGRTTIPPGQRDVDGVAVTYLRRLFSRGYLSIPLGTGGVLRGGFDVVHCFGLRDGLVTFAGFVADRNNIPVVLEPMGMAVARINSVNLKVAFDRVLTTVIRDASATIATSELEARELHSLRYANIVVRPNPIVVTEITPPRPVPTYDICYVGRLHKKKRLGDIVHALAAHPEWTAVVAGPDEDGTAKHLHRAAAHAGVGDRLTLRGWVSSDERIALIRASRCFVLPSATENFGNAAAEAIALGTPAVVTDQCGVAELVRESGAGVVCRVNAADVLHAIERVLSGEIAMPSANALAGYSPHAIATIQKSIYESVIRSP